jgi:two-component sensor histidine kinase
VNFLSYHKRATNCHLMVLCFSLFFQTFCSHAGSHADTLSDSSRAQFISFERFSKIQDSLIDESELVAKSNSFVLDHGDRFFKLKLKFDSVSLEEVFYRIDGYDLNWFTYDEDVIRVGALPEGNYNFIVAKQIENEKMVTLYSARMEVKAGLFHGIRGYITTFILAIILVVLFFKGRTFILRRDKRRTVKMLENTVQRRTVQLQQLLAQRELLLKEIHHRVKNNLQVISSLLEMQSSRTTDENVRIAITESQNRVLSIAFIHQNLYQHDDLKGVEIGSFLKELTSHIKQVFEKPDCPVDVRTHVPEVFLDIDSAIPIGLIINELLTNSYKYAFFGRSNGEIVIELKVLPDGDFYFRYFDNGVGLPKDYDFTRSNSLGLKLIRQLSRQLAGHIKYEFKDGSSFELIFKNLEARSQMI